MSYSNGSHVGMATALCMVCGKTYTTGDILLDKRMRKSFPASGKAPPSEYGLCEKHQKMYNDGYITLVGIDPEKSMILDEECGIISHAEAHRTGLLAHLKTEVWGGLFNVPLPEDEDGKPLPMAFVPDDVIHTLQSFRQKLQDDVDKEDADDGTA